MKLSLIYTLAFSCLVLFSCKSRPTENTLNYMENIEKIATETSIRNSTSTIQPGDQLVIWVTARDMDVVKPFNQNYSSGEIVYGSSSGGNTPNAGVTTVSGPSYTVDHEGNIDFSSIGTLNTTGKTLSQFKEELTEKIRRYVINPTVSIRHTNFKVSVLGEVNRQGDYIVPNGKATLYNALAMAGDLTMYGKRNDVLVVRNVDGVITHGRINMLDANFINSPFFDLKQGDVIYVSANETKEKTSKLDPKTSTYISIAGVVLSLAGIFITIFKK